MRGLKEGALCALGMALLYGIVFTLVYCVTLPMSRAFFVSGDNLVWLLLLGLGIVILLLLGLALIGQLLSRTFANVRPRRQSFMQPIRLGLKYVGCLVAAALVFGVLNGLIALLIEVIMGAGEGAKQAVDIVTGILGFLLLPYMLYLYPASFLTEGFREPLKRAWTSILKKPLPTLCLALLSYGAGLLANVVLPTTADGTLQWSFGGIVVIAILAVMQGFVAVYFWRLYVSVHETAPSKMTARA